MRATLARQSGSRKPFLRPRRTTQRTVVIGARPAPLVPQNGLLASTACTFSTTCVFAYVCTFRRAVVIRVRLDGVHISTKANARHFWAFKTNLRASAAGGPFWVAWVVSLKPPAPFGRPGPQRQPRGTPRTRFGSSGVVFLKSPGPLWEASRPPPAPQRRSRDGANTRPVTQN